MMKKDSFKKLGILGVSFALMASPLAFAEMQDEDEPKIGTTQETDINNEQGEGVSIGDEGDDEPIPGTGGQTDVDTGTRGQPDLDEDDDEE